MAAEAKHGGSFQSELESSTANFSSPTCKLQRPLATNQPNYYKYQNLIEEFCGG